MQNEQKLYPRECVHVAIADRVWKDPVGEYDRLFRFLGVAECAADDRVVGTALRRENATEKKAALAPELRARLDAVYAGEGAVISPYLISENVGHSISYISHSSPSRGRMFRERSPGTFPEPPGTFPSVRSAKMCEIGPYILYLSLK